MSDLESRLQALSMRRESYSNESRRTRAAMTPTYINVEPAAIASREGRIMNGTAWKPPRQPQQQRARTPASSSPRLPLVPQSQEVKKFIKEPSYSTVLRPEGGFGGVSTSSGSNDPLPIYANLSLEDPGVMYGNSVYASPPSPVSSSYSELRQATKFPPGYHLQQLQQQQQQQHGGSVYGDSVYEPIATASDDFFGLCSKCLQPIVGEQTGCEAMQRRYHVQCFSCHHCRVLLQGKPFYALDGKPFCREDYLNTLEKCCVCQQPICERILRATGKPYHPQCFTCVRCRRSLDGVPFTVDAANRIHCIPCFHRAFAPKCSVCGQPIMPEGGQEETVRVVALDRSFHVNCYRCEDCRLVLSSEDDGGSGCYPLDGHVLCKGCNTRRIQALTDEIR